mmetsp:Transcript_14223/g.32266  ORF Transcript_14223/g.32266 Transcript_14223/m.32266 type:complete len:293 (+) Transcript_14223:208-1086(+)
MPRWFLLQIQVLPRQQQEVACLHDGGWSLLEQMELSGAWHSSCFHHRTHVPTEPWWGPFIRERPIEHIQPAQSLQTPQHPVTSNVQRRRVRWGRGSRIPRRAVELLVPVRPPEGLPPRGCCPPVVAGQPRLQPRGGARRLLAAGLLVRRHRCPDLGQRAAQPLQAPVLQGRRGLVRRPLPAGAPGRDPPDLGPVRPPDPISGAAGRVLEPERPLHTEPHGERAPQPPLHAVHRRQCQERQDPATPPHRLAVPDRAGRGEGNPHEGDGCLRAHGGDRLLQAAERTDPPAVRCI